MFTRVDQQGKNTINGIEHELDGDIWGEMQTIYKVWKLRHNTRHINLNWKGKHIPHCEGNCLTKEFGIIIIVTIIFINDYQFLIKINWFLLLIICYDHNK